MKVLHIISSLGPLRGGPSVALPAMGRALLEHGVEVSVVTTNDNGPGVLDVLTGEWSEYEGLPTWFLPRWSPPIPLLREFAFAFGWKRWAREQFPRFDLLHIHALFSYLPTSSMAFARQLNIPFVLRPLGLLEDASLQRSAWKKNVFLALGEKKNLRAASAIHFTSERERLVSRELDGLPSWVVPLGAKTPPLLPAAKIEIHNERGWNPEVPCLIFLSRWAPKKQLPLLLRVLDSLRGEAWNLILAGGQASDLDSASRRILDSWKSGRCWLPGFVDTEEKQRLLAAADIFVLPSRSENFGIAVAEAMASGLPVVLTPGVALAAEVALHSAGWVCPDSEEGLRSALLEALQNPAERERRSRAAATLAADSFSWSSVGARLAACYAELLEQKVP